MGIVVYGHMASQPTRAVVWLLKMHEEPFDMVVFRTRAEGGKGGRLVGILILYVFPNLGPFRLPCIDSIVAFRGFL